MNLYNVNIFLKALLRSFSFNRMSLRYFSLKRIFMVFIFGPFCLLLIFTNLIFMALDEIFFPAYRRQELPKIVFIIGVPRSATTYLLQLLNKDKEQFTAPKLWELLFAPSIFQKIFFIYLNKLNKAIGNPLFHIACFIDRIFFLKANELREIGINKAEEDEYFFLYNFSSIFYYSFFPGVQALVPLVYHDMRIPQSVKIHNMAFYHRCIQRHNYVFNRDGKKYYLSKNPSFIPKMDSLVNKFPNAKIIYPFRNPFNTIPSTISLLASSYSMFCKLPEQYPLSAEIRNILIDWYLYASKVIETMNPDNILILLFNEITQNKEKMVDNLSAFLSIDSYSLNVMIKEEKQGGGKFISKHLYDKNIGIDAPLIRKKLTGVIPNELLISIH